MSRKKIDDWQVIDNVVQVFDDEYQNKMEFAETS